ncbi:GGDEF domain-containing response regulator [filamentous cyanobacterium CCP5]|nr:GGDEF domain-containing response regulator [filamentous cyanobacterium CCP5]
MPLSILVVDDNPDNFDTIETLLAGQTYQLHYAPGGAQALAYVEAFKPVLILLDVMMPNIDGLEVCRQIKAKPEWRNIPIIMVTALTAKEDLARCLHAGADDFISKPVNPIELRARVHSMLRIYEQHSQIQQLNQSLEAQILQRTARIQQLVDFDELTQMPNRRRLLQKIAALLRAVANPSKSYAKCALIYLDCDQFQLINDSLGHEVGNQVLVGFAERLSTLLTAPDMLLARVGEDEFCLLLPAIATEQEVHQYIEKITHLLESPFLVRGYEVFVTASMGIAFGVNAHQPAVELLQNADTALYTAKKQGRSQIEVFDQALHQQALTRLQLENDLRRALSNDEFIVFYQPIYRLQDRKLVGFEALVRWQHPTKGIIPPSVFIPCIEQTGLIIPVGKLVLRKACEQLKHWQQRSHDLLIMHVNLSVRQFSHPYLLDDIETVLQDTEINPTSLKLEITESALLEKPASAVDLLLQLRQLKVQISIDDFGTGYSSLSYLNHLPVDTIKIDRSFIHNVETNPEIVSAIVTLGHAVHTSIVAEGIETEQQALYLQALGCEYGQGYWLGRPAAANFFFQPQELEVS